MTEDEGDIMDRIIGLMSDGQSRTNKDIHSAMGGRDDRQDIARAIHALRATGDLEVIDASSPPLYRRPAGLPDPAQDVGFAERTLLDERTLPDETTPTQKPAPTRAKGGVIPVHHDLNPLTERAAALMEDGKPRTWVDIAEELGVPELPDVVRQRLLRRGLFRVGMREKKGIFALETYGRLKPVGSAERTLPPEPARACSGSCGCAARASARPANTTPPLLDAILEDALDLAEEALAEYVIYLADPRLDALIQAARNLRDARALIA